MNVTSGLLIDWNGEYSEKGYSPFINLLKYKVMFNSYKQFFVWLLWLIISLLTGCIPFIILVLFHLKTLAWDKERERQRLTRFYRTGNNVFKKRMCSNKSVWGCLGTFLM